MGKKRRGGRGTAGGNGVRTAGGPRIENLRGMVSSFTNGASQGGDLAQKNVSENERARSSRSSAGKGISRLPMIFNKKGGATKKG